MTGWLARQRHAISNELERDQSTHHKGGNFVLGSHKTAMMFVNMVYEKQRVLISYSTFFNKLKISKTDVLVQILTGCSIVMHRNKRKPVPAEYVKAMKTGWQNQLLFPPGDMVDFLTPHCTQTTDIIQTFKKVYYVQILIANHTVEIKVCVISLTNRIKIK